jgi:hypothetical protein
MLSGKVVAMALDDAFEKAWDDIRSMNAEEICTMAGVPPPDGKGRIWVPLLGENFAVSVDEGHVMLNGTEPARQDWGLIVLHYLIKAMGMEPTGHLVSFRELQGGNVYWLAYEGRSIKRIQDFFGERPEALHEGVRGMECKKAAIGDVGYVINVLPRVPVTVAVWRGDDELPASANVLFDETVKYYLHTEDAAVLGGIVAAELIRRAPLD